MAQAKPKSKRRKDIVQLANGTFEPIALNADARQAHEKNLKFIALYSRVALEMLSKTKPQLVDAVVGLAKDAEVSEMTVDGLADARELVVQMAEVFDIALSRMAVAAASAG